MISSPSLLQSFDLMDPLSHLLQKRLNQHKLGESAQASHILFRANEKLSDLLPESKGCLKAVSLSQGVLWVECSAALWSQELWGVSSKLLESLHSEYGSQAPRKVRAKSLTSS